MPTAGAKKPAASTISRWRAVFALLDTVENWQAPGWDAQAWLDGGTLFGTRVLTRETTGDAATRTCKGTVLRVERPKH
jgi:hypothetical protein